MCVIDVGSKSVGEHFTICLFWEYIFRKFVYFRQITKMIFEALICDESIMYAIFF